MAQTLGRRETVDLKELLVSEIIHSEALVNLLEQEGIITKQELLEETKKVKAQVMKVEG